MTTLRPYPEYKSSGIDWLRDLPRHWETRKVKHVSRLNPSKSQMGTPSDDDLVTFVPMERLGSDGSIDTSLARPFGEVKSGLTYFGEGDVILAKITPCFENGKSAAVRRLPGGRAFGSTEYHVIRPARQINIDYLYRIVSSKPFLLSGEENMEGSAGQKRVPTDFVSNFPIPIPPLDEQQAIADFLDAMDERITRFIAARRRMIALLEEQKQAIINQAVTRGLDPDVPMKPSGIDWLGEIPEHWKVTSLGRLTNAIGGMTPSKDNIAYWSGDIPWISPKDMKTPTITNATDHISDDALRDSGISLIPVGSTLVVVRGMILARHMPVAVSEVPLTINQDMKALVPRDNIDSYFLARLLASAQDAIFPMIDEAGHGTRRLPTPALLSLQLAIPPLEEQRAIVQALATASSQISGVAARHQREIELIQEYRTRLISDVVTGKVDVRGMDPPRLEDDFHALIDTAMDEDPCETEVLDEA